MLNPAEVEQPVDASTFVFNITPFKAESAWQDTAEKLEVGQVSARAGPAKSVVQLMRAKHDGENVLAMPDRRALLARLLLLEPRSIPAFCSGVMYWHFFACRMVGDCPARTLPPRRSLDICRFMAISKCRTTGNNYVYHARNACRFLRLTETWFDKAMALQIDD